VTASLARFKASSAAVHPQVDHNGAAQAYYMPTWKQRADVPVIYMYEAQVKLTGVTTKFRAYTRIQQAEGKNIIKPKLCPKRNLRLIKHSIMKT
jgi:hypothetical protein